MSDISKKSTFTVCIKDSNISPSLDEPLAANLGATKTAFFHTFAAVVPDLLNELRKSKDGVYKVLCGPEGAELTRKGERLFHGVFRDKNGKIAKHAELQKLGLDPIALASQYHTKLMLAQIVESLEEIKQEVKGVRQSLDGDRRGQVNSGVSIYEEALLITNEDRRYSQLHRAAIELSSGTAKCLEAMRNIVAAAPKPGFSVHVMDKTEKAMEQFSVFFDYLDHYKIGVATIAKCYLLSGEPAAARRALLSRVSALDALLDDELISKAELLPPEKTALTPAIPEVYLADLKKVAVMARERHLKGIEAACAEQASFELEIDRQTLLEIADGKM